MADLEEMADTGPAADAINATETPVKVPATPEGMALAYGSILIMALLPIFIGSFRSIKCHEEMKTNSERTGGKPETLTKMDAAMFPLIASCALFGLYLIFEFFSKEHVNMLLSVYFIGLGVFALSHLVSPVVSKLIPSRLVPVSKFHLSLTTTNDESSTREVFLYDFSTHDLIMLPLSTMVGAWYLIKKHWIANNLFGLAFAINGVELIQLNNVLNGCILLGGLFIYDIFWVFGTNVMLTVVKSFEAPIKLVFPQDLLERGLDAENMAMLGLGDVVIPGIFVALLLRFDHSLQRNSYFYFYTTFMAYITGLFVTIGIMHWYKHAQPALLYLVPACISAPLFMALVRGDLKSMLNYRDHPDEEDVDQSKKKE